MMMMMTIILVIIIVVMLCFVIFEFFFYAIETMLGVALEWSKATFQDSDSPDRQGKEIM